jgi:wyosine [tRNA(Phe)-imidazoG37] synthetase (radical SAM superfamily)
VSRFPAEQCAVFGPVPSRRLGLSLGVDLLIPKTCSLDCVYCESGPTTKLTTARGRQRDPEEVLRQVRQRLAEMETSPDFITVTGSGEPTLDQSLGRVLTGLRALTGARLAVITNSTLTPDPAVRAELCLADVIVPSLDAVSERAFRRVNRPAPGLAPAAMIEGLVQLRHAFKGQMWLEILLVAGLNDAPGEIEALVAAAAAIAPNKVQLNTVVRPPALASARPVPRARLLEIAGRFSGPVEIIAPPAARAEGAGGDLSRVVVEMTRRRPCTVEDVAAMAGLAGAEARRLVEDLVGQGRLKREEFGASVFYRGLS